MNQRHAFDPRDEAALPLRGYLRLYEARFNSIEWLLSVLGKFRLQRIR